MKCYICGKELILEKKRYVIDKEFVHRECYFKALGKEYEEQINTKPIWRKK